MASTFTPNIQLNEPARNDLVGTWDTPVNSNMTLIDLVVGGIATIPLNNSGVVLSAAQFQAKQITFSSTLTGSVAITFPTSFTKSYEIQNACSGSSAFTITLTTTSGGQVICCPPGETIDCFNDGSNIKFKNLGRIGGYWDYAGSSVPAWVSGCTVPPYINCDGTSFSSATFPTLALILGGTTLPNSKGRVRFALDQSAGQISSAWFSGSNVGATAGSQATTLITANLPPYTPAGTVTVVPLSGTLFNTIGGTPGNVGGGSGGVSATASGTLVGQAQGGTSSSFSNLPPSYIGGLTLIRSA